MKSEMKMKSIVKYRNRGSGILDLAMASPSPTREGVLESCRLLELPLHESRDTRQSSLSKRNLHKYTETGNPALVLWSGIVFSSLLVLVGSSGVSRNDGFSSPRRVLTTPLLEKEFLIIFQRTQTNSNGLFALESLSKKSSFPTRKDDDDPDYGGIAPTSKRTNFEDAIEIHWPHAPFLEPVKTAEDAHSEEQSRPSRLRYVNGKLVSNCNEIHNIGEMNDGYNEGILLDPGIEFDRWQVSQNDLFMSRATLSGSYEDVNSQTAEDEIPLIEKLSSCRRVVRTKGSCGSTILFEPMETDTRQDSGDNGSDGGGLMKSDNMPSSMKWNGETYVLDGDVACMLPQQER